MQQVRLPPASCLTEARLCQSSLGGELFSVEDSNRHHVGSNLQYFSFDNLSKQTGRQNVSSWFLCVVHLLIHLSVKERYLKVEASEMWATFDLPFMIE